MERESREGNSGWERVRTRRERRDSARIRRTEGSRRTSEGRKIGQHHSYRRANWRDHKDVTTFYFTRFPEDATAEELWYHFKQTGDVREVFIPRNRNRQGRRYGFVRFKGVRDMHQVQKKLDNMVFGGMKMYVNAPKYGRAKNEELQIAEGGRVEARQPRERKRDVHLSRNPRTEAGFQRGSYAEVVTRNNYRAEQRRTSAKVDRTCYNSTSEVNLDISLTGQQWLKEAWVGRLQNLASFDSIEDEIWWDSGHNISLKYMGGDMVLILGLTEEKAERMLHEEDEGWGELFHSIEKWNPKLRPGFRLTWLQCWGIPLVAWDRQHIQQIVSSIGDVVDADDCVEERRSFEVARILVKTPWKPLIQHTVTVQIKGETFQVHIAEENAHAGVRRQQRSGCEFSSSEEIISEDDDEEMSNGGVLSLWRQQIRISDLAASGETAGEEAAMEATGKEEEPKAGTKEQEDKARRGRGNDESAKSETEALTASEIDGSEAVDYVGREKAARGDDGWRPLSVSKPQQTMPGPDGEGRTNGMGGQGSESEPLDKEIVRRVIKGADTVQITEQCLQNCSAGAAEDQQKGMRENGGERNLGKCDSTATRYSLHENGKRKDEMNVREEELEEGLGYFKSALHMPRDLEKMGLVDLGLAIHTPPKDVSLHNKGPFSTETTPSTSWLVYSRKGRKKKNIAHADDAVMTQESSPALFDIEPGQQKNAGSGIQEQQICLDQSQTQMRPETRNQEEHDDQNAESVWNMVTELGLTTGTSKSNFVQKLEDMEERDGKEAASLGIKKWTP
ncbi:hypothetical protein HKD37_14G039571 [Glycine soja]|nr:hypothetical protein JHK87_039193 [Glycine soja]